MHIVQLSVFNIEHLYVVYAFWGSDQIKYISVQFMIFNFRVSQLTVMHSGFTERENQLLFGRL